MGGLTVEITRLKEEKGIFWRDEIIYKEDVISAEHPEVCPFYHPECSGKFHTGATKETPETTSDPPNKNRLTLATGCNQISAGIMINSMAAQYSDIAI